MCNVPITQSNRYTPTEQNPGFICGVRADVNASAGFSTAPCVAGGCGCTFDEVWAGEGLCGWAHTGAKHWQVRRLLISYQDHHMLSWPSGDRP